MKKRLIQKIKELKKKKDAIILVHNYQWPEIYEVADFIGDSLELAKKAAETKAKIIVFCGVDFMAESAKILNPEKKVLLPAQQAKCPMAAMVTAEELRKEKKRLKKKYKDLAVVCYINTSAAVKAESDICCTSANAVKIVQSLKQKNILLVPDANLADYVTRFTNKNIIPWNGFCYVHAKMLAEQVKKAKELNPKAEIIAHPECPKDIIDLADHVKSTAGMVTCAKESKAKEFIICTEMGMVERLKLEVPGKRFYTLGSMCMQMKKNNLERVYDCLLNEKNEIDVDERVRVKAKKALERMLKLK